MIDAIASIANSLAPSLSAFPLRDLAAAPPPALTPPTLSVPSVSTSTDASFGQMLAQVAGDAVSTLKTAEAASMSGIQGKVSVQKVVETVMHAQETLQTTIAIRDKVVSAYQEISRMAI